MYFGDKRSEFFDNRKVNINDLYDNFDMIILLDGKRNCKKNDVKLSIINMNTLKLTFQTQGLFTNENCSFLNLSILEEMYDRLPKEEAKNDIGYRVKSKYEYLLK